MRIGILTLPFNNNYGGYLQSFALMHVLKELGHIPTIISRSHPRYPLSMRIRHTLKASALALLGMPHKDIFMSRESELRVKGALMMPFVDKHITPRTRFIYNNLELKLFTSRRFDAVIVGSDQVWRPDYGPDIRNYFLNFVSKGVMKIAYAASFGKDDPTYTDAELTQCKSLLQLFKAISLREQSGLNIIEDWGVLSEFKPCVVLDPTMLLEKGNYQQLIEKEPVQTMGKAFCYVLDESKTANDIINAICKDKGITPFHIIDVNCWKEEHYVMPSIEAWLRGIYDAECVITDSFHGTVFSILFNKPFVVYANRERGISRFQTLLESFDLLDRIAETSEQAITISKKTISWDYVNRVLYQRRKESLQFLISSLS